MAVTPHAFGNPPVVMPAQIIIGCNVVKFTMSDPNTASPMECAISIDGGVTFTTQPLLWPPLSGCVNDTNEETRTDPMIAASPTTGDLYVGGLSRRTEFVQHKGYANGTTLDPWVEIFPPDCSASSFKPDKGLLAMGPQPSGSSSPVEAIYLAYRANLTPGNLAIHKSSDAGPPAGLLWGPRQLVTSNAGGTPRNGTGAYPVVVESGQRTGRLLLASMTASRTALPEMTKTDDGGLTWQTFIPLNKYGQDLDIFPIAGFTGGAPLPGDTNPPNFPTVALDPSDNRFAYVIFAGRTTSTSSNVDLFIARSATIQDESITFLSANTVRVTDEMLRVSFDCPTGTNCDESDEWLPSITIDEFGGINILYVRSQSLDSLTDPPIYISEVRYARWANFSDLLLNKKPYIASFGPSDVWHPLNGSIISGHDYQMIKAAGCYVYAAYARAPQPGAAFRIYFRKVRVGLCRTDYNLNGLINEDDLNAFFEGWVDAEQAADMDGDSMITGADIDTYTEAYCEGCTVPN